MISLSNKSWAVILVVMLAAVAGCLASAPEAFSDESEGDRALVAVLAEPAPDGFSDGGDGFFRVLVQPAPDGFSDGGDGLIAVWAIAAPPEMPVIPDGE